MRVLITGGTGLIGRALSANLAADGREVIVLSRSPEQGTPLPDRVQVERWDARTAEGWGHLADGAGAIVSQSRINSSRAVVEAVTQAEKKPRAVVQSSAVGYYGFHGDEVLTEEAEPGKDWAARCPTFRPLCRF